MKVEKKDTAKLKKFFMEAGPGSKSRAALELGIHASEITRAINGGPTAEEKLKSLITYINQ